ncbi:MAG TPA: cupin domain-containing protein [Gemmatimonadales bacterium]|nr:cupin domain-containing protein [Gemmatimonadales bacterium]
MRLAILTISLAALPAALLPNDENRVTVVGHDRVTAAFAKGSPLIETGDYKIHASRRDGPGLAEIHTRDTDIAYVIQGSATLVTGGAAVNAKPTAAEELRGTAVRGGESRTLVPGDVVVIPNGVPHWFKEVNPPFLYYVVKVRQAERPATEGGI